MSNPTSPSGPPPGAALETIAQEVAWLEEENARLRWQNAILVGSVKALERRLGLNSSKLSTSDGLQKLKAQLYARSRLRGHSGRKPGG